MATQRSHSGHTWPHLSWAVWSLGSLDLSSLLKDLKLRITKCAPTRTAKLLPSLGGLFPCSNSKSA